MEKKYQHRKALFAVKWIRSRSGNTWLCPVSSGLDSSASEEELRKHCIEESKNPQND